MQENTSETENRTLTRRERKKLTKLEAKKEQQSEKSKQNFGKTIFIGLIVLVVLFLGWKMFESLSKPLPGEAVPELGRGHVEDISQVVYNSNPPTSGDHFAVWAKPGVYDRLISDGYFLHSMEHGYIIIWYDCEKPLGYWSRLIKTAHAQEEISPQSAPLTKLKVTSQGAMSWFTADNPPELEVDLPEEFNSESCKNLVSELSEFTKIAERIVITPRLDMEHPIVLTAWGRIQKFSNLDKQAITNFIKAFHNRGPEKTLE